MSSEAIPAEEKNKKTVRRFYEEVFGQGSNLDAVEEIFASTYVLHDRDQDPAQVVHPPAGVYRVHDPASIAAWVKSFRESFSEFQVSIIKDPMAAEGNRVVTRFTVSGFFKDAADLPVSDDPRGIPVEWEGISISQFSEGKITESWSYWQSGRMYEQLGYFAKIDMTIAPSDTHDWRRPPRR
jgi:predicted ester cyclase